MGVDLAEIELAGEEEDDSTDGGEVLSSVKKSISDFCLDLEPAAGLVVSLASRDSVQKTNRITELAASNEPGIHAVPAQSRAS